MSKRSKRFAALLSSVIVGTSALPAPLAVTEQLTASAAGSTNVLEYLDRGISAINTGSGMLVSWRYLINDDASASFNLYRDNTLIYEGKSGGATCYLDKGGSASSNYRVDTLVGGKVTGSADCRLISNSSYFDIPLTPPTASGITYSPNDMSVGDIDGDGQYELFLKWDPSNSQDNSKTGNTGKVYIDCIRLDGTRVWRVDLGINIRAGAHYTQFFVADFDLDGRAEMACKTCDGTVDGTGKVIGDGSKDYRANGTILTGPEYYTLFDGATGAALDTVNYSIGRGVATGNEAKNTWGDNYGNRCERYWGMAAYLDGVHPCIVTGRGYYTRMTATAYTVQNKKLVKMWDFDTGFNSSAAGYGDGNHNSMPADVDGDGKQEIITGATCIDDNGKVLWCTNTGHGDAMHVADLDPDRPGIEVFTCHEDKESGWGVSLFDGRTGAKIFHYDGDKDTGRCGADNVWAGNPGAELWGARPANKVMNTKGEFINMKTPAMNFFSYWNGDLERELLDGSDNNPAVITKINANGGIDTLLTTDGCATNNSTKANPCLSADLFGDWREELVVRKSTNDGVRIYCTPYETDQRVTTLMHDAQYRMQVSAQNTAYNQPPHLSYFLGTGYDIPRLEGTVNTNGISAPPKTGTAFNTAEKYTFKNVENGQYLEVAGGTAAAGTDVVRGTSAQAWSLVDAGGGYYKIYSELGDGKTYMLDIDYGKTGNGTNIGIYTDTKSDAQSFKFVKNDDGTYTICTKVTNDASCIGIIERDGADTAIEWECTGNSDQKWIIEPKIDAINGKLIKNLIVQDTDNRSSWSISTSVSVGDPIYGDRDFVYISLPDEISGSEAILPACNSKNAKGDLGKFTAGSDMFLYILVDTRVEDAGNTPPWLSGYTRTNMTAASSNDVTFAVYKTSVKSGETVVLGNNNMTGNCINYTVFAKEDVPVVTTTTTVTTTATTTTTTAETTTTTTEPEKEINYGDANDDGGVTIDDAVLIMQALANPDKYGVGGTDEHAMTEQGKLNADCFEPGSDLTAKDALSVQRFLLHSITELPEK